MKIRTLIVGQLQTNCYIVYNDTMEEAVILDPGDDAQYIEHVCADLGVSPVALVATHGHFDHILAATELKLAYNIPFYMNPKDQFLLERMQSSAVRFTGTKPLPAPSVDIALQSGILDISTFSFEVIETPGHTPGSVCLRTTSEIFVGDLLFADGSTGRIDFKYSRPLELSTSLSKFRDYGKDLEIYPGHGPSFYL